MAFNHFGYSEFGGFFSIWLLECDNRIAGSGNSNYRWVMRSLFVIIWPIISIGEVMKKKYVTIKIILLGQYTIFITQKPYVTAT